MGPPFLLLDRSRARSGIPDTRGDWPAQATPHRASRLHRRPPVLAASRWLTRPEPVGATPQTEAERQAEHQRLEDTETAESLATGKAQWHVRVELGSHHHAVMLARTLENEGRPVVRRWKFLIVGASNEDQARELAGQIRQEAPPDATVIAEQAGVGWPFMPS